MGFFFFFEGLLLLLLLTVVWSLRKRVEWCKQNHQTPTCKTCRRRTSSKIRLLSILSNAHNLLDYAETTASSSKLQKKSVVGSNTLELFIPDTAVSQTNRIQISFDDFKNTAVTPHHARDQKMRVTTRLLRRILFPNQRRDRARRGLW